MLQCVKAPKLKFHKGRHQTNSIVEFSLKTILLIRPPPLKTPLPIKTYLISKPKLSSTPKSSSSVNLILYIMGNTVSVDIFLMACFLHTYMDRHIFFLLRCLIVLRQMRTLYGGFFFQAHNLDKFFNIILLLCSSKTDKLFL